LFWKRRRFVWKEDAAEEEEEEEEEGIVVASFCPDVDLEIHFF